LSHRKAHCGHRQQRDQASGQCDVHRCRFHWSHPWKDCVCGPVEDAPGTGLECEVAHAAAKGLRTLRKPSSTFGARRRGALRLPVKPTLCPLALF
jgi:hypothetical protein